MRLLCVLSIVLMSVSALAERSVVIYPYSDYAKVAEDASQAIEADYHYGACFIGNAEEVLRGYFSLGDRISDVFDATYEVIAYSVSTERIDVEFSTYEEGGKNPSKESLILAKCDDELKERL